VPSPPLELQAAVARRRKLSSEDGPPVSSATWIQRYVACSRTQGVYNLLGQHYQAAEALLVRNLVRWNTMDL
jgi:hypothetical protein